MTVLFEGRPANNEEAMLQVAVQAIWAARRQLMLDAHSAEAAKAAAAGVRVLLGTEAVGVVLRSEWIRKQAGAETIQDDLAQEGVMRFLGMDWAAEPTLDPAVWECRSAKGKQLAAGTLTVISRDDEIRT